MEPPETPFVGFWDRPQGELLGALRATAAGLTSDEAKRRLRLHGPNSLVQERRFAALLSFVRFFGNPLITVLLVASAVSLSLGDRVGGLIIIATVLLSVLLNFFMVVPGAPCRGGDSQAGRDVRRPSRCWPRSRVSL